MIKNKYQCYVKGHKSLRLEDKRKKKITNRNCLGCDELFFSIGIENRMCKKCRTAMIATGYDEQIQG
jgi:hypothetical protein